LLEKRNTEEGSQVSELENMQTSNNIFLEDHSLLEMSLADKAASANDADISQMDITKTAGHGNILN